MERDPPELGDSVNNEGSGSATPDGEIDIPSVGDHLRELIESERLEAEEPADDDAERAGYIKRIDMVNFMCHDNLTIEFGPRMNFITGKNGSGKSTVLTALTTCLGGKASSTNRGSSVKSLIKEGKSRALIRATIANKGAMAYDHNRFGDVIQIERRLDADSSGSYKIMNSSGKVVSSSKEELRKILSIFSIFVDNPFAILTQDTARSFLTESNAESKYQHFKRAMTMDKIENYREGLGESLVQQKQKLAGQKEIVNEMKAKAKEVENKFNSFKKLDSAEKDLRYWNAILEWNKVFETESKVSAAESTIDEIQKEIENIRRQCDDHEGISAQKQTEIDQVQVEVNQVNDTIAKLNEEINSIKDGNRSNMETTKSLKAEKANIVQSKEQSKRQIVELEREKAKLLDTSGFEAARRQKHEQLDRARSQLEKLASESENDEQNKSSLSHKEQQLEERLQSAQDQQRKAEARVQQERARWKELQGSQTNAWSTYAEGGRDADFKGFMAHFEKTNFQDSPIGPIGRYVTLKDPAWSSVLEQTLKRATSTFIAFCQEDRDRLRSLLRQHRLRNPVLLRSRELFSFEQGLPSREFTTVLDVLDISNEYVKRALIDANRIEQTILIAERSKGADVMKKHPENVRTCIARDQKGGGYNIGSTTVGVQKTAPIQPFRLLPRMSSDNSAVLRQVEEEVKRLQSEAKTALERTSSLGRELRETQQQLRKLNNTTHHRQSETQRLERRIAELTEELEDSQDPGDDQINDINARIEKCKDDLASYEKQLEDNLAELIECEEKKRQVDNEISVVWSKVKEKEDAIKELQKQETAIRREKQQIDKNKDNSITIIAGHDKKIEKNRQEIARLQQQVKVQMERAQAFSEDRVEFPSGLSVENIRDKIRKITSLRDQIQERYGDTTLSQVYEEYLQVQTECMELKKEYKRLYSLYKALERGMKSRTPAYKTVLGSAIGVVKASFSANLNQRGFSGSLLIDPNTEALSLQVAPGSDKSKEQDTSTLSGGEKSFSQIALLAAMWMNIGSRLLALDEFDVFMDKVNRRISLNMVIDVLRNLTSTQSIFITPQELETSDIDFDAPDINLFRMSDPERRVAG
ncbi:hypothetical protein TRICI_003116 [Trichomonascus ciferrii]|uniref:Rad50/SbcC-type AAA domain-containing protein n=1 Tax=Trichomonascus ciferrii TaxID=44093 RepID=A0A642V424_9ASCO|nr:hypothetical protein TRICI_003116 [Trichomonascus ciferrii]